MFFRENASNVCRWSKTGSELSSGSQNMFLHPKTCLRGIFGRFSNIDFFDLKIDFLGVNRSYNVWFSQQMLTKCWPNEDIQKVQFMFLDGYRYHSQDFQTHIRRVFRIRRVVQTNKNMKSQYFLTPKHNNCWTGHENVSLILMSLQFFGDIWVSKVERIGLGNHGHVPQIPKPRKHIVFRFVLNGSWNVTIQTGAA